jgi:hypothetical protein
VISTKFTSNDCSEKKRKVETKVGRTVGRNMFGLHS